MKTKITILPMLVLIVTMLANTFVMPAFAESTALPEGITIECADGKIRVGGSFDSAQTQSRTYRIYLATYSNDNSLIKMDISEEKNMTDGTNEIEFDADFVQNVQNVRAFVWDGNLKPLAEDVCKTVRSLKILAIGNSFSDDALAWIYRIAKAEGIDSVYVANSYIGGCSVANHYSNSQSGKEAYTFKYISDATSGVWQSEESKSLQYCLQKETWNLITVQQASGSSGIASTYSDLEALIGWINMSKTNPYAELAWHMTWAYQQNSTHADFSKYSNNQLTMYNAIIDATKSEIVPKDEFDFVIPSGTVIQNLRTSFIGDTLTRDGYHMSSYLGRYAVGLTWFKMVTGLSIDDVTYVPSSSISSMHLSAIKECINNAVSNPYEVTQSQYEQIPVYLSDSYEELDWEPEPASFYNSQNTSPSTKVKGSTLAKKFFSSALFAREGSANAEGLPVIPDGSIIMIADDYQYRPDAWTALDTQTTSRPGNVTTSIVIVDDAWWGSFNYRGFNISNTSETAIDSMTADELADIFKIYIPVGDVLAYKEADLGITLLSYYDSTKGSTLHRSGSVYNKYASSKIFEKTDLPDGAIIAAVPGYQYRPDAWTDLSAITASRPGAVNDNIVTVNSDWWGSFNYRGFNISKNPAVDISDLTEADIKARFKIYIPQYEKIDWEPVRSSYYNSTTDAGNRLTRQNHPNTSNLDYFISSKIFGKNELPVGTVIKVANGYQYRPEAFISLDTNMTTRHGNVKNTEIIVDDAWWGSYNYRAFNISSTLPNTNLSGLNDEEIDEIFRIYVPK